MAKTLLRGLQDIKTHAVTVGTASKAISRYAVCLKIAMLEIERERRLKERTSARAMVHRIDQRLVQIEQEVQALEGRGGDLPATPEAPSQDPQPQVRDKSKVFRF